jgi:hypothetical protein
MSEQTRQDHARQPSDRAANEVVNQYRLRPVGVLGHKGESSRTSHSSSWVAAAAGQNAFLTRRSGQTKLFRLWVPVARPPAASQCASPIYAYSVPPAAYPPLRSRRACQRKLSTLDLTSLLRLDCKSPSARVRKHWLTESADLDVRCHRASPKLLTGAQSGCAKMQYWSSF